ncbi:MAG: polyhydroxyalkanoic acid system family protein [Xanthomonadales bacterium]|nr:polyhydroxyalkanoic acid system family protein [Xanthomonadales bacterium]
MATIDIERTHHLDIAGVRTLIDDLAAGLHRQYGLDRHWQGDVLQLSGNGVSGAISIDARSVRVTAELGFLLRPWRRKIEQDIRTRLERHLT